MSQALFAVRETEVASARRFCLLVVQTLLANGVVWHSTKVSVHIILSINPQIISNSNIPVFCSQTDNLNHRYYGLLLHPLTLPVSTT